MMMKIFYSHFLPCCFFIASTFCYSNAFSSCHSVFVSPKRPSFGNEGRAATSSTGVAPVMRTSCGTITMCRKRSVSSTMTQKENGMKSNLSLSSHATKGSSREDTTHTSPTEVLLGLPNMVSAVAAPLSAALLWVSIAVSPAYADGATKEFKLPPINLTDPNRCVLKSSAMGQANAARDALYDLRQCSLSGSNAVGFDLSGVIMGNTDLSKANLQEAYFSKGYLRNSKFDGADFTNAIVDRANFKGSSLRGTIFKNTVLTATSFEDADVENADFTDAYLGDFDIKNLCKNPTLKGENPITMADTRLSVGCSNR